MLIFSINFKIRITSVLIGLNLPKKKIQIFPEKLSNIQHFLKDVPGSKLSGMVYKRIRKCILRNYVVLTQKFENMKLILQSSLLSSSKLQKIFIKTLYNFDFRKFFFFVYRWCQFRAGLAAEVDLFRSILFSTSIFNFHIKNYLPTLYSFLSVHPCTNIIFWSYYRITCFNFLKLLSIYMIFIYATHYL